MNNSNYAPSSKASEGTNRSKVSKRSKQRVAQPKPEKATIRGDPTGQHNLEKEFNSKEGSFSEYENLLAPMQQQKEFTGTFGSSPSNQDKVVNNELQAAGAYLNQIGNTGMLDSGAENYTSSLEM